MSTPCSTYNSRSPAVLGVGSRPHTVEQACRPLLYQLQRGLRDVSVVRGAAHLKRHKDEGVLCNTTRKLVASLRKAMKNKTAEQNKHLNFTYGI